MALLFTMPELYQLENDAAARQAPPTDTLQRTIEAHIDTHYRDIIANNGKDSFLYQSLVNMIEAPLLATVLKQTRGNRSEAAQLLGLSPGTLRKKLKDHRLL